MVRTWRNTKSIWRHGWTRNWGNAISASGNTTKAGGSWWDWTSTLRYERWSSRQYADLKSDYEEQEVVTFSRSLTTEMSTASRMGCVGYEDLEKSTTRAAWSLRLGCNVRSFEALSCETFLRNESLLRDYFDEPSSLFKAGRSSVHQITYLLLHSFCSTLTIPDDSGPCTAGPNSKGPTVEDFEWAIRDPLLYNLKLGATPVVDVSHVRRWDGVDHRWQIR
jgi:hypothetical protein